MEKLSFDEQIARNQRATIAVMAFMLLILFGAVFAVGVLLGTPPVFTLILALAISVGYVIFAHARSTETVILASEARPANPSVRAEKLLIYKVEEMALAAGLPPPRVYVQESRDINAFAAGLTPKTALVCMTSGALEQLTQEELEGVIAHEMAHIANQDVRLATVTVGVVGAIAMISEIGLRMMWFGGGRGRRDGNGILLLVVALAGLILAPILSRLTYLFLSRKREYLADATGARLTRNPEGLAAALEKIRGDLPDDPKGSKTVAGLYLANPWSPRNFSHAWHTHPPIDERIRRLRGM